MPPHVLLRREEIIDHAEAAAVNRVVVFQVAEEIKK
jgi:hypothetical protein